MDLGGIIIWNLICNVYPIMMQRYFRGRVHNIISKREERKSILTQDVMCQIAPELSVLPLEADVNTDTNDTMNSTLVIERLQKLTNILSGVTRIGTNI